MVLLLIFCIRIINNGQLLKIIDAQLLDVGGYLCVASNAAGNDSKAFHIEVQGKS